MPSRDGATFLDPASTHPLQSGVVLNGRFGIEFRRTLPRRWIVQPGALLEHSMSVKLTALGVAAFITAAPVTAQQRGTLELGVFGSGTSFDNSLRIENGAGGGFRLGAFLDPRWSLEFDGSGSSAGRPVGLGSVQVNSLSARLALTPFVIGPMALVFGAGGVHTDYEVSSSYGMSGLVGAKVALGSRVAVRVDAVADYMPDRKDTNVGVRAGLSFFRHPFQRVTSHSSTGTVVAPLVSPTLRSDSVSATEQRRLRLVSSNYRALRDSLARSGFEQPVAPSSVSALATMREMIHFATDSATLTDASKAALDAKVAIFSANPAMRIVIVGNTDDRATDAYNLTLGGRRADAARAYLVGRGVDAARIEISSHGESQPIAAGGTRDAQAQNRRAEFRLLVASDYLVPPKK
jgi:peptidoglycan-associated lipoprotein